MLSRDGVAVDEDGFDHQKIQMRELSAPKYEGRLARFGALSACLWAWCTVLGLQVSFFIPSESTSGRANTTRVLRVGIRRSDTGNN